ncbi:MAG TPA: CoA ester lyase [Aestuariivirga sp.]|nr:CoA ester lyase [Aestuariivirga sp.]
MRLRSLLFVPGDQPERMEKAFSAGADALILDLEDSVTHDQKDEARERVAKFLSRGPRSVPLFVRINPLGSGMADDDLAAIIAGKPNGIVLPKAEGGRSLIDLDQRLKALGDSHAVILPIATETPAAIFALGSYGDVTPRLCGLTWGAEDLPAAIGAATSREEDGRYTPPYEMTRSLILFGAHAAGVPAIETVYPAFRDLDGLKTYAARGRRDGFAGMMAIHPSQVEVINAAFTPNDAEIAWARRVVELFDKNPGIGALSLDGKMVDAPHLKQAKRLLAEK